MAYVALKPCGFAGQRFKIGETIPADLILPGNSNNLVKMGIIASTDGTEAPSKAPEAPITVTIRTSEGDMSLEPTPEGLQAVFDALTGNASDAEKTIKKMDDGDALILLNAADSRKSIKEATEARAKALSE